VSEALSHELYALERDRARLLAEALQLAPDHAPARWHTGHVQWHGRWVKIDDFRETTAEQRLREHYERMRSQADDSAAGHLALANWCAEHNLPMQERAHLNRVIQIVPDHVHARQRLNHVRIGGTWVEVQDLWLGRRSEQEEADAMREWASTLQPICKSLRSGNARQRTTACERLRRIVRADAIPALETQLAGDSEAAALVAVETLAVLPQHESSLALARLAVLSPWKAVRDGAAEQLKQRPHDHFVPALLAELSTPVQSRMQATLVNGRIVYRHAFSRETQDRNQVRVMDAMLDRKPSLVRTDGPGGAATNARGAIAAARAETAARAMADVRTAATVREMARLQQNTMIHNANDRICAALRIATGADLPPSPKVWWEWWDDRNEVTLLGDKAADVAYSSEYRVYEDEDPIIVSDGSGSDDSSSPSGMVCECFVAGTPVWTIKGPMPIEMVQVGDLVLSQNPDTGELAYKPVLQTTIRPPEPLLKVSLCVPFRTELEASGGHPLWVAGEGWMLVRQLQSGMVLHGVDHVVRVSDVQPGSTQRTYNLVVADFHTYVVGDERLICHDNTPRRPSNALVPGLPQR
jgi:hypothetical protein